MFTVYRIGFAPARKPYRIGLLFTHKNSDFFAISVLKGAKLCRADLESDRFCAALRCSVNRNWDRSGSE